MTNAQETMKLLELVYEHWLLETYPDEIHNKEDHIKAVEIGLHREEFIEYVKNTL